MHVVFLLKDRITLLWNGNSTGRDPSIQTKMTKTEEKNEHTHTHTESAMGSL